MTLAFILVVAAVFSFVVILGVAISRNLRLSPAERPGELIEPIDVEAFRNLVDPAEDDYLRRRLSAPEFRRVQRERLRAAAGYVQAVARNAAVLVRLGQAAMASNRPDTAAAAHQLVDQALLLRRNAAFALCRIYVALAWPNSSVAAAPILNGYMGLSGVAMLLGRLQNPAAPVRISSN
jgi:hypothetical protein